MKRVFLIGYMGTGKTSLGKIIAKKANLTFVDLDHYIENRYHKSISQIFAEKGESGFRDLERETLREVGQFEDVIIATGGGTPIFFDNIEFMNNAGKTIFLKTAPEVLFNRLKIAKSNRPIIRDKSDDELLEFIISNLKIREPYYSKADYMFIADNLDTRDQIYEAADKVIELCGF